MWTVIKITNNVFHFYSICSTNSGNSKCWNWPAHPKTGNATSKLLKIRKLIKLPKKLETVKCFCCSAKWPVLGWDLCRLCNCGFASKNTFAFSLSQFRQIYFTIWDKYILHFKTNTFLRQILFRGVSAENRWGQIGKCGEKIGDKYQIKRHFSFLLRFNINWRLSY